MTIDQATLLLYLLLHRNQRFYKYVMAQQNLQQLVSVKSEISEPISQGITKEMLENKT